MEREIFIFENDSFVFRNIFIFGRIRRKKRKENGGKEEGFRDLVF